MRLAEGRGALALAAIACLGLAGCGQAASASGETPDAVVTGYMTALAADATGGQQFLEKQNDEKLVGPTTVSRYVGAHKGASWKIVPVPGVGLDGKEGTSPNYCLVLVNICIVTVEVDTSPPAYFHVAVEHRYGPWQIINVDRATGPTDGLPAGNEAHQG